MASFCSFRILRAPTCPVTSLKNALFSNANPCWERQLIEEWKFGWRMPRDLPTGYATIGTTWHFTVSALMTTNISEGVGNLWQINMTGHEDTLHASRHASHQYAPRSSRWRQVNLTVKRFKEYAIWTSTACLSGSHHMSSFGRTLSYRMQHLQSLIGV